MKLLLSIFVVLSVRLSAQPFQERYTHLGDLFVQQFSSAPFPHPKRAHGHTNNNQVYPAERHYNDSSVAIFIPKGYRPARDIDVVVYFHGWNNNIDSACAQFKLIEQFSESRKNAVFVFPEGPKDSPDSFCGRLEENDGLKNLLNDVLAFVRQKRKIRSDRIGSIILAGHSGAYRVIAFCLLRGGLTKHVSDVILFDALYGQTEKFSHWIDRYQGRFINIYTDSGGTKYETENLMTDLKGWGIPYSAKEEKELSPNDLKKNRLNFIHTDVSHNEVIAVRHQFRDYLSASRLKNIQ